MSYTLMDFVKCNGFSISDLCRYCKISRQYFYKIAKAQIDLKNVAYHVILDLCWYLKIEQVELIRLYNESNEWYNR